MKSCEFIGMDERAAFIKWRISVMIFRQSEFSANILKNSENRAFEYYEQLKRKYP